MASSSGSSIARGPPVRRARKSEKRLSKDSGSEADFDGHDNNTAHSSPLFMSDAASLSSLASRALSSGPRRHFPFAAFEIRPPSVKRNESFVSYPEELSVKKVIQKASAIEGQVIYEVRCGDGEVVIVSFRPPLDGPDRVRNPPCFARQAPSRRPPDSWPACHGHQVS